METKLFNEVFPKIKLNDQVASLMGQTRVSRITRGDNGHALRIYLSSDHLIGHKQIASVQKSMADQFSHLGDISVTIITRFNLSAQYNLKNLYKAYRESILDEMKDSDHILYDIFYNADVTFPEDGIMDVVLEDGFFQKARSEELEELLTRIFNDRCGVSARINISFARREPEAIPVGWQGSWVKDIINSPEASEEKAAGMADRGESTDRADRTHRETDASKSTGQARAQGETDRTRGLKDRRDSKKQKGIKRSDDPNVIYGSDFSDDIIPISEIIGDYGNVAVRGQIVSVELQGISNERTIVTFSVTDFEDTIKGKIFTSDEYLDELTGGLKIGSFVRVAGSAMMDTYEKDVTISRIKGICRIPDFTTHRMDNASVRRVELHCHTQMSEYDAVSSPADLVKRAYSWGMRALAITDHGVVHGFTDAYHTWCDLWKAESKRRREAGETDPDPQDFFKIIYGCEGYLVNDLEKIVTGDLSVRIDEPTYVVFDIETTGFSPVTDRIIEIGAVKIRDGAIIDRFSTFINPEIPIPYEIEELTSINDDMVMDAGRIEEVLPEFIQFIGGDDTVLVGHNVKFDAGFIRENMKRIMGREMPYTYADTMGMARVLIPGHKKYTLDAVAKQLKIPLENHHRAVDDAECTAWIYLELMKKLKEKGIEDFAALNDFADSGSDIVKSLHPNHVIILAKNNTGRMNLYRLVSMAHLQYFSRYPRIPKSLLEKYREGLIIGSACEAGELYEALVEGQPEEKIASIVDFYDYLEIQPVENNRFMINSPRIRNVNSEEDIRELNRRVVELGEKWNKPVVATGDVHFMDPEDILYRRIILDGHGFDDADTSPELYLRTTDEMLDEFAYLGEKKAYEIVVTNTNRIADMIDHMSPVRPDKCPPVIEDSDKTLRQICENKAHEMYGDNLPDVVRDRMEKELESIIGNGFAVMYIIAQKLVWKSVEDGYLVGSRGSVGSSFVAFLAGISEVNSLPPHYLCPECHYTDFDSDDVKAYGGMAGCDMPSRKCPVCGHELLKDGFDIPFETFLGFKGDKEPDIDLNFSSEYQSKAHAYTEVIFGHGQTYRAGTISSLKDKTAFGFVRKYYEKRNQTRRKCEMDRIALKCMGVRTTSGQHPGGIVVLPMGEDIYTFTPIQHPANKEDSTSITTHFDYHSIDHNLLKLDILGKDDPTQVRILQDITGVDPLDVPLDDPKVMSLFQDTSALGIRPEDIGGTKLGCLAIPEFGTDNCINMVLDAKPKYLSDLIRISGLGHGEGVWDGNAKTLIKDGKATISTAICCRDDIMIYLIQKGLDPALSFEIMEKVRKGVVAKKKVDKWPEWTKEMEAHGVPDWYIWSCEQIQYMFPKAHAAAYVIMAWRMGWYKIYYPAAFYATYFSIKETGSTGGFSYEKMAMGRGIMKKTIEELRRKEKNKTIEKKEQSNLRAIRIVEEMYARGIEFAPIDIMKADARRFTLTEDGKIMPSINSIDGIGDEVAESIAAAAAKGEFLSRREFKARTRASQTAIDRMTEMGILSHLPESGQLSIFDIMNGVN